MTNRRLQIITATGGRPEAFKLCQDYMARQDFIGPVEWHIIDDGQDNTPIHFARKGWRVILHRLEPMEGNSQHRNMLHGIESIDLEGALVVIEDDDWYAADWLTRCSFDLLEADLIGETHARYYNVRDRKGLQLQNAAHASLCSTAMSGGAIEAFKQATMSGDKWIDMRLWQSWPGSKKLMGGHSVVGIKGMPGRGGIGCGHDPNFSGVDDKGMDTIRQWLGSDASIYERFWAGAQ